MGKKKKLSHDDLKTIAVLCASVALLTATSLLMMGKAPLLPAHLSFIPAPGGY